MNGEVAATTRQADAIAEEQGGGVAVAEAPEAERLTESSEKSGSVVDSSPTTESPNSQPGSAPDAPPLAELAREHQRRIVDRMIELDDIRAEAEETKKSADKRMKGAEAEIDVLRHEMMSIVRGQWQPPLPFPVQKAAEPAPSEAWKSVALCDVEDIPTKTLKILGEQDFATLGDIAALQATGQALTDIEGIGPKKATEIENALDIFWQAHPEYTRPAPPAPGDEIHTPDQLGLTAEEITAQAFPHLLTPMQLGKTQEVRTLPVRFVGDDEEFRYLNIGATADPKMGRGVHVLKKLFTVAEWEEQGIEVYSTPADAYCGAQVKCMGEVYRIGPKGDGLLVRVG
jgi:hypothetical protein